MSSTADLASMWCMSSCQVVASHVLCNCPRKVLLSDKSGGVSSDSQVVC